MKGSEGKHMKRFILVPVVLAAAVLVAGATLGLGTNAANAEDGHASVLVVSQHKGVDSATCGTPVAPCATVTQAINNAQPGDTVRVKPGTYHEQVVVPEPIRLVGYGATIDATGLSQGSGMTMNAAAVLVLGSASGSTIEGLRVQGAYGEGILVMRADHVRVAHNTVTGNDVGTPATTTYFECQPQGQVPGDCGEGIHLMSATDSRVAGNTVTGNSGGILVTDELGPASGNWISGNFVATNQYDCGITLPSHNPNALSSGGARQPTMGGVYGNTVSHNRIFDNGLLGEGAGVLIAASAPGTASYDNTVVGNVINGNDLAGVTIHAHAPNQDVSGNVIEDNTIGTNNIGGDPDAGVSTTTGVLVFSAVVPVTVTINDNHIHGNVTPVWTSSNVTVTN